MTVEEIRKKAKEDKIKFSLYTLAIVLPVSGVVLYFVQSPIAMVLLALCVPLIHKQRAKIDIEAQKEIDKLELES